MNAPLVHSLCLRPVEIAMPMEKPTEAPREASSDAAYDDRPLHRLLAALPSPLRKVMLWLLRTRWSWLRISIAILLILGGLLGFLPILGFWMVPVGLLLMSQDVPFLRRPTMRALGAVQRWWDHWRRGRKAARREGGQP